MHARRCTPRWAVEVNVAGIWMMRERAVVAAVRYANNSKDSMGGRETVETNSSSKQSSNGITTVTTRARIRDRAEQTRCDRLMALALAWPRPHAPPCVQSNPMPWGCDRSGAVLWWTYNCRGSPAYSRAHAPLHGVRCASAPRPSWGSWSWQWTAHGRARGRPGLQMDAWPD